MHPIPERELGWKFSRSSGPGGQHVNTSDTRVELTWSLTDTTVLTPEQKARAAAVLKHRLIDGTITVVSSQYRSQHRNRESARARLQDLVAAAVVPPKSRRATRPTRGSVRRTNESKKRRSQTKQGRRGDWT
ncbi:alternative ribosome rescue aminoacyl-tRNA hydrolase ArfB [Aeromicrobium sp. CF3.5]|uniref:alternative ribosome rescue aminoacyl-tRNA hydrolase ArfB n=1 Tax=Aeromicrobium sp. CF3.5 TaxID=3373078 RepID=UPI003EE631BE